MPSRPQAHKPRNLPQGSLSPSRLCPACLQTQHHVDNTKLWNQLERKPGSLGPLLQWPLCNLSILWCHFPAGYQKALSFKALSSQVNLHCYTWEHSVGEVLPSRHLSYSLKNLWECLILKTNKQASKEANNNNKNSCRVIDRNGALVYKSTQINLKVIISGKKMDAYILYKILENESYLQELKVCEVFLKMYCKETWEILGLVGRCISLS